MMEKKVISIYVFFIFFWVEMNLNLESWRLLDYINLEEKIRICIFSSFFYVGKRENERVYRELFFFRS